MTNQRNHAGGAGLKVFSSSSMQPVLMELAPAFERATGYRITASYDAANLILRRINDGESADAAILAGTAIDVLIGQGRITARSRADLARSGIGVAVRAGAPRPRIDSVEEFRHALLAAKTIAFTTAGASGVYFSSVIDRLGIAAHMRTAARTRPAGLIGELIVSGEAEIAVQQIPELLAVQGIDLVGPLPAELHRFIMLSVGIFIETKQPGAAQALLEYLATPAAARVMQAKGMEPV